MHKKKLLIASVTVVLLSVLFVLPVSAHGHHDNHHKQNTTDTTVSQPEAGTDSDTVSKEASNADAAADTDTDADTVSKTVTQYPICTVTGCTKQGIHTHDGCYYCGNDHENGYCDGTCKSSPGDCNTSRRTYIIRNRHHHH